MTHANEVPRTKTCTTSALSIEKLAPRTVQADETFDYEVRVTNRSETPVDVTLTEALMSTYRVLSTSPPSMSGNGHGGHWMIGPLYPGQSASVRLTCKARRRMHFRSHTSLSFSQEA